jgi:hypothetical protein
VASPSKFDNCLLVVFLDYWENDVWKLISQEAEDILGICAFFFIRLENEGKDIRKGHAIACLPCQQGMP